MLRPPLLLSALLAFTLPLGFADQAFAKKKADKEAPAEDVKLEEEDKADDEPAKEADAAADGGDEEKEAAEGDATTAGDAGGADASPVEEKGKSYYFVGARARAVVIPTFIIEAFGDGGKTVMGPSIGPEFGIRRDGFEYDFAIAYTAYPMDWTPFKAPTDPPQAMELVQSHVKVLYFTADFLWSHAFSPEVAFLYGGAAGLGFVWGPLYRVQAYPGPGGAWTRCNGPNNPNNGFCAPDPEHNPNQHFGDYQEPSWADGGDKPLLMPWLALQMGLRFKPHRRFVGRLDFGIGIGQLFFGIGADYGL